MRKTYIHTVYILIFFLICHPQTHAQRTKSSLSAGEQRKSEKGLKDNRSFFYFINPSVTNLGNNDEKKIFREAAQRDIIAQILYMKFLFHESWIEIRKSQKLLIELYTKMLKKDIKITKDLLNSFAPEVIRSRDHLSRSYLKLGYRDSTLSGTYRIMADNYHPRLYSLRLYKYVEALKLAKHSKRYAFLSILRAKSEKKHVNVLSHVSYSRLKKMIVSLSSEKKDYYTLLHSDNYFKYSGSISLYDKIWEEQDLFDIREYREYLKIR